MSIQIAENYHIEVVDVPGGQEARVVREVDGLEVATLVRLHASSGGNKLAGDYPGVDAGLFTVDNSGHLVSG